MLPIIILFIATLAHETSSVGVWKPAGCDFFTRQNASKILGTDVTWNGTDAPDGEPKKWTCTFVAKDSKDGPKLYFGLHHFGTIEKAKEEFDAVVESNKNHAGFEKWTGVGDDALVHSNGQNFQLVMVRKGVRSFRIKVNPSATTSLENVKAVAGDLVRKMEGEE